MTWLRYIIIALFGTLPNPRVISYSLYSKENQTSLTISPISLFKVDNTLFTNSQ